MYSLLIGCDESEEHVIWYEGRQLLSWAELDENYHHKMRKSLHFNERAVLGNDEKLSRIECYHMLLSIS